MRPSPPYLTAEPSIGGPGRNDEIARSGAGATGNRGLLLVGSRKCRSLDLDRATPYLLAAGIVVVQQIFFSVPLGNTLVRGAFRSGSLTALDRALGMALTYRSNRSINFAQADMGTIPRWS